MKLAELHRNVDKYIKKQMNIQSTLSILNIPKQSLLHRGNLVMLLDEYLDVLSTEWLREGHYHVQIMEPIEQNKIQELIQLDNMRVFETDNFDSKMDVDRYIEYKFLPPKVKKTIKEFLKHTETIFLDKHKKYGIHDANSWKQSIIKQNGHFTMWCVDNGYGGASKSAIMEAYKIADKSFDWSLKRRAAMAKAFNKIKIYGDNK